MTGVLDSVVGRLSGDLMSGEERLEVSSIVICVDSTDWVGE